MSIFRRRRGSWPSAREFAVIEERSDDDRQHETRRTLLKLHAEAAEWFHENLMKRELGAPAREYLKKRGIIGEVAQIVEARLRARQLGCISKMGEWGGLFAA